MAAYHAPATLLLRDLAEKWVIRQRNDSAPPRSGSTQNHVCQLRQTGTAHWKTLPRLPTVSYLCSVGGYRAATPSIYSLGCYLSPLATSSQWGQRLLRSYLVTRLRRNLVWRSHLPLLGNLASLSWGISTQGTSMRWLNPNPCICSIKQLICLRHEQVTVFSFIQYRLEQSVDACT